MSDLEKLAADCELYAKIIDGITIVDDDWQPGCPEHKEPRETLQKAAAALRGSARQDGVREALRDCIGLIKGDISGPMQRRAILKEAQDVLRRLEQESGGNGK